MLTRMQYLCSRSGERKTCANESTSGDTCAQTTEGEVRDIRARVTDHHCIEDTAKVDKREEKVWHDQNVQTDRLQSFDFLCDRVQEADFVAGRATHGLRDKRVGEQQRNN